MQDFALIAIMLLLIAIGYCFGRMHMLHKRLNFMNREEENLGNRSDEFMKGMLHVLRETR